MAAQPLTPNDLSDLKRLKEVWRDLKELVLKCRAARKVTAEDNGRYDEVVEEARLLYGRLQRIIGTAGVQQAGRTFDAFQHVLGQSTVYSIIHDDWDAYHWQQLWSAGDSVIGQAVGRVEARLGESQLSVTPEAVARWSWLLNLLEEIRFRASWLFARPKFVERLLHRIEGSWLYRIATVVTTFAAFFTVMAAAVTGLLFLLFRFVL